MVVASSLSLYFTALIADDFCQLLFDAKRTETAELAELTVEFFWTVESAR